MGTVSILETTVERGAMGVMNGQARDAGLAAAPPQTPPSAIPVYQAGPASSWPQQEKKTRARHPAPSTAIR
jgi:hypothetical protein